MAHESSVVKYIPDFSEDDFCQAVECFVNGAWYPRHETQLARISRVSAHDTGVHGELVSAAPFYLCYRTGSFIPQSADSFILGGRRSAGAGSEGAYCFTVSVEADTLEMRTHNALFVLAGTAPAAYCVPLFFRRRDLAAMRHGRAHSFSDDESEKGKILSSKSRLLRQSAVITPDSREEKTESRLYTSYGRNGTAVLHSGESAREIRQDRFFLNGFLESVLSDGADRTLSDYADDLFSLMPELFGQGSGSRKYKHIIENVLFECLDEKQISSGTSMHKGLDRLDAREKLVIIEKLLRDHFGIIQYFRLKYRS